MPKLKCPCGFLHDLTPIPDDGWKTVRDRDYEAMIAIEVDRAMNNDAEDRGVYQYWGLLYDCPECGRIMWKKPHQKGFTIYRVDER